MVTSLSDDVDEFWFENPGIEPFENTNDDPFNEDWYNPPRLNGEEGDMQSSDLGDSLISIVSCL